MEKETTFWFFSLLLAAPQCFSFTVTSLYFKEGVELRLNPSISEEIWAIGWMVDGNPVCEWVKDKVPKYYYPRFEGRTTMNTRTAELEIRNATKEDAGIFTLEFNRQVLQDQYRVQMIEEVPKPTLSVDPPSCGPEFKKCTLSCNGNTENMGPVSYLWRLGDDEWEIERKDITVYNTDIIQKAEKFSCRLKNPVSQKWSDPLQNPLFPRPPNLLVVVGLSVLIFLVVLLIGMISIHNWTRRSFIEKKMMENDFKDPQITPEAVEPLTNPASTPQ